MRTGRMLAFVVIALLAGGIVSQLPSAMGDSDPFSSLWDAIFDLQSRDDNLQAQIDELRAERDALLMQTESEPVFVSDPYTEIDIETIEDGRTLVHITAGNSGPDRAAGVKLTAFYLMPLFEINSIDGNLCEDKSRGIIECAIGTLEEGQESVITVDTTARESGEANTWTVDISTTTVDADYANNHVTYDFETGSGEEIEIPQVKQTVEELKEETAEEPEAAEPEPEQETPASNSTGTETVSSSTSTETEEPQESSTNQTSAETTGDNQTSSETVDDSGSNSTAAEPEDVGEETEQESSEEAGDGSASEEQSDEAVTEEQPEEQTASKEREAEESPQDSSDENPEQPEGSESEETVTEDSESDSGDESSGASDSGSEELSEEQSDNETEPSAGEEALQ